jgi:hypothetical protein
MDAQTQKRKKKLNKVYYSVSVLAAPQTSPRQHLKSKFSKSDAFKKEAVQKFRRHSDHRSLVFTLKKVSALETMPSTRLFPHTTN